MTTADAARGAALPGRVVVTTRAQQRVFAALAAEELGATARATRVALSDDLGRVRARITAPASMRPEDGALLTRVAAARRRVAEDGARLTGAAIGSVLVHVTAARGAAAKPRRVS
ncbi:MAG: hypothetical protein J0J05_12625 [Microbacterium sp.]|uniref:hypothetical protein n=1 Tax=Microbacterium sp. TaxID=51671 RepID=UPI001AC711D2|nr:hypothetical protein [Microbacterium sp.]MBN9154818.1 hypothetical protein [Microbacterium sp.]